MAAPLRDLKGLTICVGCVLVLYWQPIFAGGFFFQRDVWLYWLPHIEWAVRIMASGHLPQWNPFKAFGSPFLADPNFQFFYPPSILNWILPGRVAYTILVVGHALLGSIGAFRLLRPRLRSRPAALVGAMAFMASGPLVSSANLWHHFSSAAYMPWVLDAFLRLRGGRRGILRLGGLTGLQALAGSADVCLMTGAGMILLLPARWTRVRKLAPKLAAAAGLCMLLAAVQWLPTAILARQTARASLGVEARLHWSVSPSSLVDLLLPLSGVAHAVAGEPDDIEERLRLVPWMYMGASTLPFLLLGARTAPRAAIILVFSILLSVGRHTPLAEWAGSLPLVSSFRFPAKLLWFVAGCWATLSAIGFRALERRKARVDGRGILVGSLLIALAGGLFFAGLTSSTDHEGWTRIYRALPWAPLALGGALLAGSSGRRGRAVLAFVIAADLLGSGQTFNAYASAGIFTTRPAIVDELESLETRRIFVAQATRSEVLLRKVPQGWSDEEAYIFSQGQFLLPPQSMRWSIRGSFDGDFTGLTEPQYAVVSAIATGTEPVNLRLLQVAGVTHIIRFAGSEPQIFPVAAQVPTLHDRPVLVLNVPSPRPPVYVVDQVLREATMGKTIQTMMDSDFDPTRAIVRIGSGQATAASDPDSAGMSEAHLELEENNRMVVRAHLTSPGTVVVLNGFSEGWTAKVDGTLRPILPANLLFQSVDLGPGDHRIELEYQTPGLVVGFVFSLIGWLILAVGTTRTCRRHGNA